MNDTKLLEIRARDVAATPGPWVNVGTLLYGPVHVESKHQNERVYIARFAEGSNRKDPELDGGSANMPGDGEGDASFCAHARTDIPALLAHIEELKTALGNEEAESFALGIEIMLGKQVWTTEPKCGAWNWWRLGPEGCPTCRYVYKYGAVDHATRGRIHWQEIGGQWCPIPIPQEPTSE